MAATYLYSFGESMSEASYRESQFTGSPVQSIIIKNTQPSRCATKTMTKIERKILISDFTAPEASCTTKNRNNYLQGEQPTVSGRRKQRGVACFVQIK